MLCRGSAPPGTMRLYLGVQRGEEVEGQIDPQKREKFNYHPKIIPPWWKLGLSPVIFWLTSLNMWCFGREVLCKWHCGSVNVVTPPREHSDSSTFSFICAFFIVIDCPGFLVFPLHPNQYNGPPLDSCEHFGTHNRIPSAEVEEARISLGGRVTVYGLLEWRHEIQHGKDLRFLIIQMVETDWTCKIVGRLNMTKLVVSKSASVFSAIFAVANLMIFGSPRCWFYWIRCTPHRWATKRKLRDIGKPTVNFTSRNHPSVISGMKRRLDFVRISRTFHFWWESFRIGLFGTHYRQIYVYPHMHMNHPCQ